MSTFPAHKKALSTLILILAVAPFAGACGGCDAGDRFGPRTSPEELTGFWQIVSYAADETGCQPRPTEAPYFGYFASWVTPGEEADEETGQSDLEERLDFTPCFSADHCLEEAAPEDKLPWNFQRSRAQAIHFSASLATTGTYGTECRLTSIQTLAVPLGNRLELTRSHYELHLPIEGDEACNAELAAEYRSQLPCVQGELFHLARPAGGAQP